MPAAAVFIRHIKCISLLQVSGGCARGLRANLMKIISCQFGKCQGSLTIQTVLPSFSTEMFLHMLCLINVCADGTQTWSQTIFIIE